MLESPSRSHSSLLRSHKICIEILYPLIGWRQTGHGECYPAAIPMFKLEISSYISIWGWWWWWWWRWLRVDGVCGTRTRPRWPERLSVCWADWLRVLRWFGPSRPLHAFMELASMACGCGRCSISRPLMFRGGDRSRTQRGSCVANMMLIFHGRKPLAALNENRPPLRLHRLAR